MTRPLFVNRVFWEVRLRQCIRAVCAELLAAAQNDNSHITVLTRPSASRAIAFYRFQWCGL